MNDKLSKLLRLISDRREEIESIVLIEKEYYFLFRGKSFSIMESGEAYSMFAYPRWHGSFEKLAHALEHGAEAGEFTYVFLSQSAVQAPASPAMLHDLWNWLESKYVGIDDLLRDFGIE